MLNLAPKSPSPQSCLFCCISANHQYSCAPSAEPLKGSGNPERDLVLAKCFVCGVREQLAVCLPREGGMSLREVGAEGAVAQGRVLWSGRHPWAAQSSFLGCFSLSEPPQHSCCRRDGLRKAPLSRSAGFAATSSHFPHEGWDDSGLRCDKTRWVVKRDGVQQELGHLLWGKWGPRGMFGREELSPCLQEGS